jgi:hypothetical protein
MILFSKNSLSPSGRLGRLGKTITRNHFFFLRRKNQPITIWLTLMIAWLLLIPLAGCQDKYGQIGEGLPQVTIRDAVMKPDLAGREVKLVGRIVTQCLSNGCWFVMQDDTGNILVDLKFLDLGLPASAGKKVTVTGIVTLGENRQVSLSARGLIVH